MDTRPSIDTAFDCTSIEELIPEYAFGLTDSADTRLVDSNLAACLEAANQLEDFRQIQAEMRAGVAQLAPPRGLEDRLMAAITAPVETPAPVVTAPAAPRVAVVPGTTATPKRGVKIQVSWLAVAAALVALVGTNLFWANRVNDLSLRQNDLVAQLSRVQNNTAFVLTGTNDLRWVRLPPSQQNGDASAFMMWNAESKTGLLYARGFPKLASGKTYQLWLTRGEERVSVGTFRVDEEGKGALLFNSNEPIDKFTWARITAEPATGSQTPSDTIVVNGKLSA